MFLTGLKRLAVFGVAVGLTLLLGGAALYWYTSFPAAWDTATLTVVSVDDAQQFFHLDDNGKDLNAGGFLIRFSVRNSANRDVTLSAGPKIMWRRKSDSALVESRSAKFEKSIFVPAGETSLAELGFDWSCGFIDDGKGKTSRDSQECYRDLTGEFAALVLFDDANRMQLTIPVPALKVP